MSELRFYNTLTRKVEAFRPLESGKARLYHCGPTVYQRPHIGNYRAFLFADLLRRLLEARGYAVTQVMNLTDVGHVLADADEGEDKLEAQARKEQVDPWELVERISAQFFEDLEALEVRNEGTEYPRATDHIPEMVELINELLERGHAYRVGDNIYFDVRSFPGYGKLSGNRIEDLEAGARVEVNSEKKHPADFALWKSDPRHIMKWDTEFGPHGFPGWHIECSAMSMKYLGRRFDIHTGGEDNVFPHHECEIAQSEGANGEPFVNLWMHTRFLMVDGGKMSKSLGNVYSLDDLAGHGLSPLDFRFFILRAHYRGSLNFTWEGLQGAAEARKNLSDFYSRLSSATTGLEIEHSVEPEPGSAVARASEGFHGNLDSDLNTSAALAALFTLRSEFLRGELAGEELPHAMHLMEQANEILGVWAAHTVDGSGLSDEEVDRLVAERAEARRNKDFGRGDAIRDELAEAGVVLEDGPDGARWHRG